jgi:Flp pilus assembly protein TadG
LTRRSRRPDRGTTLLLFPAAVMVLMILGAIAVDLGAVYASRRSLIREVGAVADDAAGHIDIGALRRGLPTTIDFDTARRAALADLASTDLPGDAVGPPIVEPGPTSDTIVVEVTRDVPHIFGRAVPGVPRTERITVRLSGTIGEPDA